MTTGPGFMLEPLDPSLAAPGTSRRLADGVMMLMREVYAARERLVQHAMAEGYGLDDLSFRVDDHGMRSTLVADDGVVLGSVALVIDGYQMFVEERGSCFQNGNY